MKMLAMAWSAMIICYIIAVKVRDRRDSFGWVETAINVMVYIMVFLMGLRMGANEDIVDSMASIGLQSLAVTVLTILFSMLGVFLVRKILRINRWAENIGEEASGNRETGEVKANAQGIKSTVIIGVLVALGMVFGYLVIYKKLHIQDEFMLKSDPWLTACLVVLIGVVGFNLGLDGTVFRNLRKVGLGIILFPLAAVAGSILAGVVYALISPMSMKEGIAISAGFGWYTYAPNVISQAGFQVASAVSFMHNVLREVIGIIGIPLFAAKIGYIEAAAVPGVAAMDVCVPIVERSTSERTVVYSFGIGFLMCISVPLLVPLVINL